MFKLLKWLLGLVFTLALLVLLAVLIIPKVFNPNDYRDEIVQLVKTKTNRDLRLDGDLSVSVFPWLGVKTKGLSFSQPEKIGGDMVSVDTAQLRIKLIPLLSKKVEIDTIVLDQPQLRLVTLKDGSDSFADLFEEEASEETTTGDDSDSASDLDVAIVVEGIQISNAQVIIDDKSEQQRYEISEFNLNTGNLIGNKLASVTASGILNDSSNPDSVEFELDAKARIDTDSLSVEGEDIALSAILGEDKVNLDVDTFSVTQSKTIDITQLTTKWTGAQSAQVTTSSIQLDLDKQTANIANTQIAASGLRAVLSDIVATQIVDAPKVKGLLSVDEFNARSLLDDFDVDYKPADSDVLKKVSMSASFNATKESVDISNLKFNLDESLLAGSLGVVNFDDPRIKFDLKLNSLNLDKYLPEETAEEAQASEEGGSISADSLSVPMSAFKDINVNGSFVADQLVSGGLELNDIDVKIVSSNGNVTITPKASLYDGTTDGQIAFSESAGTSTLKIKNEVDLVVLGDMLQAADITDQLSGVGTLSVDVVVTETNGVQSNEGTIKLLAKNGALKGIDLQSMVKQGYSKYQSLTGSTSSTADELLSSSEDDETKFAELLGTFYLKDFKITNDDFSMKAPLFRVAGAGDILIDAQTLDYNVDFSIVDTIKGQGGEAFDKLKGLTIPIRLKGDLSAPSYSLDWTQLYKGLAKQKIEEEKAKLLQEKLGLEGEDTSTKGVLKQLLEKEVNGGDEKVSEKSSGETKEEPKSEKDQLKDDLKNKLINGLFN